MTSPYADTVHGKLTVLCDYVFDRLTANKVDIGTGIEDVFYGDQTMIPRTPALCLEPDGKKRELQGVPRRTENMYTMYIILYVSKVDDTQANARDALVLAEAVEDFLHADPTLDDRVIHSFCTEVEPGYRTRQGTRYRACRITFQAINKTVLGM
jgi:hypothetical protein